MAAKNKERILRTIIACAKLYEQNLCGKDFLYVIRGLSNHPFFIEVTCLPTNFMHLMGINTKMKSAAFYQACLDGKLSLNDFSLRTDGSTIQKSNVSIELMSIHKRATVYGEYIGLFTDVLLGNVRGCMGHKKPKNSRFYMPNTLLEADARNNAIPIFPVLAVYQKLSSDKLYSTICYKSKILADILPNELRWPDEIQCLIDHNSLAIDLSSVTK